MGLFWFGFDRTPARFEQGRAAALERDQGNVPYQVLANVHLARGDPQAALAVLDRSPARDGPVIRAFASGFDLVMGEHERGLQRLAGLPSIVLDQNFIVPTDLHRGHLLSGLGRTAEAAARYDSARVVLEGVVTERPEDHRMRAALAVAYAHLGPDATELALPPAAPRPPRLRSADPGRQR